MTSSGPADPDKPGKEEQFLWGALGDALGLSRTQAARGIFRVVTESMAAAVRTHATDRGVDWRGMPLFAFGGAGPVHACEVAALLKSSEGNHGLFVARGGHRRARRATDRPGDRERLRVAHRQTRHVTAVLP